MKARIKIFSFGIFFILSSVLYAQDTISILFSGQSVKDAYINIVNEEPDATRPSLIASVWTHGGEFGTGRSLIGFDFSELRQNSVILDARLSLYHNPTSAHIGHSTLGGDNTGVIFRIVESWNENTVTWANQPATTNTNAIIIPAPETDDADFLDIDITSIIRDMIRHPESSDGFMIKLFSEDTLYRSLVFASSDLPDETLHPSIEIYCIVDLPSDSAYAIQPDDESGKDAFVSSVGSTLKDNNQNLVASVWEYDEGWGVVRSFLDFDLSQFNIETPITLAELSLFHDPNAIVEGHINNGGSNELLLSRITESWNEDNISWENQPSVSTENIVRLPSSNIANQDFMDIDVTSLILDMIASKNESHGFMLSLNNESEFGYNRNVVFASSNHAIPELRPRLVIYTKNSTGYIETPDLTSQVLIYPNPGNGDFKVAISNNQAPVKYRVVDSFGQLIRVGTALETEFSLDLTLQPSGIYYLTLIVNDVGITKKLVVY